MKTRSIITDKTLRELYARELSEFRLTTLNRSGTADERFFFLLGIDSGFWALQKALIRRARAGAAGEENLPDVRILVEPQQVSVC